MNKLTLRHELSQLLEADYINYDQLAEWLRENAYALLAALKDEITPQTIGSESNTNPLRNTFSQGVEDFR